MNDDADSRIGEANIIRDRFDASSLLIATYEGPELRVTAANAAFRSFVDQDDVVGCTFHELFPEFAAQQISPMMEKVFATGQAQGGREWRFQVGDSDDRRREYFLDFIVEPYLDGEGAIAGITAFAIDVTEQVRRRQADQDRATEAERRYAHALDVIRTLQQQLLPPGLPVLPSVQIAASYLLADADTAAGGDWFDAVPLPDGRVALVAGDVVGHGVAASAAMGQLRTVLQDRLDDTGDLLGAIRAADRLARRVPAAHAATVCLAALDPADGTLTWCSAGHPPPLVVNTESARYLPLSGSGPLGTGADYRLDTDRLEADDMVLIYSDGIIERPGRDPAAATVELSQVAIDSVAGRGFDPALSAVERASTQTLELLVRQSGHTDDITLLAAQRRVPPPPLYLSGPVDTVTARMARTAVQDWLALHGAGERDRLALTHAVTELVTNAYEHARTDSDDVTVTVTAYLRNDGEARLCVADNGRWRERARPGDEQLRAGHGFGLAMTAGFADHLDIDRSDDGTTATVRRRLSRPAKLFTDEQISHGRPGATGTAAEVTIMLDQPHARSSRIAIYGPLDTDTVAELGTELDRRTLGGTHELTVDLTAVTHLGSAAIAELYRAQRSGEGRPYPLRLYAPAGSTAHHVLSLINLPHSTTDPDTDDDRERRR
ncbi:SpoIIE family protein phosphatase [Actinoplanes siamensis]|uniref:PPM-type phosphatase domain-containing protein n=1 Tax=Actinoplanes siamensis TaxID=1223317 RepID=A0A919TKQ3_9ACTN|nr:SpoIIE family protein phosphatase [Actinoplanes siamensis]GIF05558.1 hypothetical protein Asi03nite_30960 [Actinoplanes siamensis]